MLSRYEISATIRSRVLRAESDEVHEILNVSSLQIFSDIKCLRSELVALLKMKKRRRRSFFELTITNYALYKYYRALTSFFCHV